MMKKTILVGLGVFLLIIIRDFAANPITNAQNISCGNVLSAFVSETSPYTNSWSNVSQTNCIDISSDQQTVKVQIAVNSGTVAMWIQSPGESDFTSYGHFPIGNLRTPSLQVPTSAGSVRVALAPTNAASFTLQLSTVSVTANSSEAYVENECDECPLVTTPNEIGVNISLQYRGDLIMIPVEVCAGELEVNVQGLLERSHVAIHVLPPTSSAPNADTSQTYRPDWNPDTYNLYSFRQFTTTDVQNYPVWFVYVIRTGDPVIRGRNVPVNIAVYTEDNCGLYPLDYAARPTQSAITSPRSGDVRQGGVDVATYCRQSRGYYIPRTVNNQFWVCYNPLANQVAFTVEQSDFNAMCVFHYGRGAYMVKQLNQTTGGNCYK